MLAHRAVALAFLHRESEDLVVNHKDENKQNNCVLNLEWVTRTENNNYMGNRSVQATVKKCAKKLYVYDKSLKLVMDVVGVNKYAREHGLSRGGISSLATYNSKCSDGNYHYYRGLMYTYTPLTQGLE